jgi:predicted nucleic acid-binding protein
MIIFLDSAPLGLLAFPTTPYTPNLALQAKQWATDCDEAGHTLVIPECTDYEICRELLRNNKTASINELDYLKSVCTYLPLHTHTMLKAAELWAQTRQAGKPTAHDENIDIDVILAAQVLTSHYPQEDIIVATANLRHLSLFVTAELWTNIHP